MFWIPSNPDETFRIFILILLTAVFHFAAEPILKWFQGEDREETISEHFIFIVADHLNNRDFLGVSV